MRFDLHDPAAGRPHVLVDQAGLDQLRRAAAVEDVDLTGSGILATGSLGRLAGVDVYLDECPCPQGPRE